MRERVWKCEQWNWLLHRTCRPSRRRREGRRLFEPALTILPYENLYSFFSPFKSFLVTQSNLNKWRGATPPSGMVFFEYEKYSCVNTLLEKGLSKMCFWKIPFSKKKGEENQAFSSTCKYELNWIIENVNLWFQVLLGVSSDRLSTLPSLAEQVCIVLPNFKMKQKLVNWIVNITDLKKDGTPKGRGYAFNREAIVSQNRWFFTQCLNGQWPNRGGMNCNGASLKWSENLKSFCLCPVT